MKFALVFEEAINPWLEQRVNILSGIGEVEVICSEMIMDGYLLGNFDAVVFPGGIKSFHGLRKWGYQFAHAVRYFVAAGGGFFGICGGAYIAIRRPAGIFGVYCNRTFALVDAEGEAPAIWTMLNYITLQDSPFPEYVRILDIDHPIISGHRRELTQILYSGGPGFFDLGETVTPLATFTEPEWKGKAAVVVTTFGQGRVCLCGPHPETPWDGPVGESCVPWLYPAMATWVAEREIRPEYPLLPWETPRVITSSVPILAGLGALTMGVIIGTRGGERLKK